MLNYGMVSSHSFANARETIDTPLGTRSVYRLDALEKAGLGNVHNLPYCIKVLLESCLRNLDGFIVTEDHVRAVANYNAKKVGEIEIPFTCGRVLLQDFTGVPAVVDLAAMRDAIVRMTGKRAAAKQVNPLVPCDLVIDHSVQVDAFASGMALTINNQKEFERNSERYEFLKWGQSAFNNFRVVPPSTGICHQVNLEYLAKVVWDTSFGTQNSELGTLYPDSLVGTDSHTTMINGVGVVGWGVGGIEAEAVMLGQPIYMLLPEVVGFKLTGKLPEGATATDLVLTVTQMLRAHGVVNKFVEYFGDGLNNMPVANRATIANMAPEYGATIGFFPVDDQTLKYLRLTGRDEKLIATVEQYYKLQGMWRDDTRQIAYSSNLELDLGSVEPSLAGPKRPQDRIALRDMKKQWAQDLDKTYGKNNTTLVHNPVGGWIEEGGAPPQQIGNMPNRSRSGEPHHAGATATLEAPAAAEVTLDDQTFTLTHGSVVIAAITSCTNTSNPEVMIAAGLLARKARARGLNRKPWVKTSLAPGSTVVTEYYKRAHLLEDLEALGFNLVGYGCTTCIGNSGPLPDPISKAINEHDLVAASVLSGNRNFEGRISPDCRANYLASPPLVVAYAIAGTVDIDLKNGPIGKDKHGRDVYLREIWPTQKEIEDVVATCVTREQFIQQYSNVFEGPPEWKAIKTTPGELFSWSDASTYIQNPPFFEDLIERHEGTEARRHEGEKVEITPIHAARCLVKVGDSVTTDHISPAGSIKKDSPAGKYLVEKGVPVSMFNSYGSRRGNDRVMTRGTFANIRVKNHLADGKEGGWTKFLGEGTKAQGHEGTKGASHLPSASVSQPSVPSSLRASVPDVGSITSIYDASVAYKSLNVPLIVLAGKDYGMGSSRDWAAKGTFLLGVKAVIAESFERIHRSNLVGMGVLPLTFKDGQTAASLGLDGTEIFDIEIPLNLKPRQDIKVVAVKPAASGGGGNPPPSGGRGQGEGGVSTASSPKPQAPSPIVFTTTCRIDTPVEVDYYRNGGILHTVLKKMAKA
jgi:aconitate hydratase